jgi:putative membrane protein
MIRNFFLRLIVNATALAATAAILPGIHIQNNKIGTLLVIALIFGIVNAVLKPVIIIMSCPLIILSLGLFAIAINGIMLLITEAVAGDRFQIDGFWWAVLGGLVVGIIASILENVLGLKEEDKKEKTGPFIIDSR